MAKAGLLFVGTDSGLVLFSNPNEIGRWLRIGQPFRDQAVRAVWALPDNPLVVFAAVGGVGLQRSDDGGQSWRAALELEVDAIVGARAAAGRLYLGAADGAIHRSDDAGESWRPCGAGGWGAGRGTALAAASTSADTVYSGRADGSVWASRDGGGTWQQVGAPLAAGVDGLEELDPSTGELIVAAGGALYRGGLAGGWQAVELPAPAAGPLARLAGRGPVLLAALADGGVIRSDDLAVSWSRAEVAGAGALLNVIAPATYHVDTAFAGGAAGQLLSSTDRGRTWQIVKQDLGVIRSIAAARLL
jgi:hypothetical protein